MDIVSFETAKKLKEAGFTQPEYIQLGFGYTDDGSRFYIEDCSFPKGGVGGMCYAATTADILRELPGVMLEFLDISKTDDRETDYWSVSSVIVHGSGFFDFDEIAISEDSAVDAVANAWLSLNAKTFE